MGKKPLEIAIQGSRSPMTNKTTVVINVQGYEEERTSMQPISEIRMLNYVNQH